MKAKFIFWVESYLYNPSAVQNLLSVFLLPLSWLYCALMYLRFMLLQVQDFGIDIISIGNLSVGGSGKTPLTTALAKNYDKAAIILRGYGRVSKGLVVVKDFHEILCDVRESGDEAMIYAKKLKDALVIVSEDRTIAIDKAKEMGAKIIFLDDAYSKHDIKKLDIIIEVKTSNKRCLPSGAFREKLWTSKEVLVVQEGVDFTRKSELKDRCDKMSLITAIARPQRLDRFLPQVVSKNYFSDHHNFTYEEIQSILDKDKSESALVTYKDYVKLENFDLPLSLLDLELEVSENIFKIIEDYRAKKN